MTDAFVLAAGETLGTTFDSILETLDGLTAEQVNARLDLEGANSLAVIALHATKSAHSWIAVALGAELPPRDRDAEFRTAVASQEEFLEELRAVQAETLALLEMVPSLPWGQLRPTHVRAAAPRAGFPVPGRSCTRPNTHGSTSPRCGSRGRLWRTAG
jgi:hypothetical protein